MITLSSDFYENSQLSNKAIAITSNDRNHDEKIILEIAKKEQFSCTKIAKIFDSNTHQLNMKLYFPDLRHKEAFIRAIKNCELDFIKDEHKIQQGIKLNREALKKAKWFIEKSIFTLCKNAFFSYMSKNKIKSRKNIEKYLK